MTRVYKGCGWPVNRALGCAYVSARYAADLDSYTSFSGSI